MQEGMSYLNPANAAWFKTFTIIEENESDELGASFIIKLKVEIKTHSTVHFDDEDEAAILKKRSTTFDETKYLRKLRTVNKSFF